MAKVLLLGASGLVGRELLRLLQQDPRVSRIIAPSREALPPLSKLFNPLGRDLTALIAELDEPIDLFFSCLGTTRKQAGSAKAFRAVDLDLVVSSAKAARRHGAKHCLVISANGANPHSRFLYNRTKGEMEQALIEQLSAPLFKLLPGKWKAIDAVDVAKALQQQAFNAGLGGITILESDQLAAIARD